jgi:hypothetical protein
VRKILQYFFISVFLIFSFDFAQAIPQLGITPCAISVQPADLSFSGTSANVHLSTCGETLIVFNNSSSDVRFRLGTASSTVALTTDLLLPSKTFVVLNVGITGLYFAAISTGSGTISFIQGTAAS